MEKFKPMLAVNCKDQNEIRFPIIATPKIDGIRCFLHPNLGPVTRALKPIPNSWVRHKLFDDPAGLDGELIAVKDSTPDLFGDFDTGSCSFQETTKAIMSRNGNPPFKFMVFDYCNNEAMATMRYSTRLACLEKVLENYHDAPYIEYVQPTILSNIEQLTAYEIQVLEQGYEGLIYRTPDSPYKFGRSTWNQQWMIKIKRFEDSEARVIGYEPLYHNANPAEIGELGQTKHSTHQENMVAMSMLGALAVEDPARFNVPFKVGSGFTQQDRVDLWHTREELIGKTITYKYQNYGIKDAPRIPIFKGFRLD